ncbi:MAG: hypothetical protein E7365_04635 [Clostridiales bacterium]|nr:hypothetical protein [Clostridiales bacterium]
MIEQIKTLLEYQEADFAVDAAEKQVKSCKERKTANAMKQRYEIAVEERKKLIAARDNAEKEMETLSNEIEKLTSLAQIDRTKDIPLESEAINKLIAEIDKLTFSLKKIEEKINGINASVAENEKKINEYGLIANKAKDEFNINKAGYEKILQEAKPEIDKLKEARDKIGQKVDKTLLDKYLRLKKNKIVPTAPLKNSRCDGCHMEMPSFTVSNAVKNGYCECENCGRITYIE